VEQHGTDPETDDSKEDTRYIVRHRFAFPVPGGLRSQIALKFTRSEDWRAIRFLHLRATEASGVGLLGFARSFGHHEFTATITILAPIDLAFFGHWPLQGPGVLDGQVQPTSRYR